MRLLKQRTLLKFADDSGHQLVDFRVFKSLKLLCPPVFTLHSNAILSTKTFFHVKTFGSNRKFGGPRGNAAH